MKGRPPLEGMDMTRGGNDVDIGTPVTAHPPGVGRKLVYLRTR